MTTEPMTPERLAAARVSIERAHTEVGDIAYEGRDRWRMSIPANPDRDSDLIVSAGLAAADELLAEVERLRALVVGLEWAETLTHQECENGKHGDWWADTEHSHRCPWCALEQAAGEVR